MPDLATLADPAFRPPKGPPCFMGILLDSLPEADAATLQAALDNPHAPASMIARALADMGHTIRVTNVQRHRRGECRCDR